MSILSLCLLQNVHFTMSCFAVYDFEDFCSFYLFKEGGFRGRVSAFF